MIDTSAVMAMTVIQNNAKPLKLKEGSEKSKAYWGKPGMFRLSQNGEDLQPYVDPDTNSMFVIDPDNSDRHVVVTYG